MTLGLINYTLSQVDLSEIQGTFYHIVISSGVAVTKNSGFF